MRTALLRTTLAWLAGLAALSAWMALALATAAPPVQPVEAIDPQRYAGTWYEIARLPNKAQAGCIGDATATYWPLEAPGLRVVRQCRDLADRWRVTVGDAMPEPGDRSGARFRVSQLPEWLRWWPGSSEAHWVVALDAEYRYAVVSEPSRRSLWILARTPTLPPALYEAIVAQLRERRYPVERLVETPHRADRQPATLLPVAGRPRLTV